MRYPIYPGALNEQAARLSAGLVAVAIALAWLTQSPWILPLLALGFVLRVTVGPRFSPLARVASALAARLWVSRPVASAPKRFAQGIGAACMTAASLLWLAGYTPGAWVAAALVAAFATLEAGLGFCLGCWIFGRLQASGLVGPAVCVDCAPSRSPLMKPRPVTSSVHQ